MSPSIFSIRRLFSEAPSSLIGCRASRARRFRASVPQLLLAAWLVIQTACAPTVSQQPFTIEVGCSIPLNNYICTQSAIPAPTQVFVVETVSFSGQATAGQTVGANFNFMTGGTPAFVWLPVQSFGPSPSAGNGVYAATLPVRLMLDPNSSISLEVYRNSSANAGQNSPYVQRLNLMGYLQP